MKRRNKGFTLIELIVVVAILVLLMLMLVPKLTGFTETAADTVCHANQLNAYKIMVLEYTLGKESFDQEAAEKAIIEKLGPLEKLCSSGGEVKPNVPDSDTSKFTISCKIHGGAEQEILGNYSKDMLEMAIHDFYDKGKIGQLDSTGPNFGMKFKKTIADKYGLNVDNFDFAVVKKSNGYSVYIFDAIVNRKPGEVVSGKVYEYDNQEVLIGSSEGQSFTGEISSKPVDKVQINYLNVGSVKLQK